MGPSPQAAGEPLGADLVIPLLALGFAVYFFFSIHDLAWEAKANGVIIGSALVVLVAIQLVRIGLEVARGAGTLRADVLWQPREVLVKRLALVAITIVFIATLKWLGLTLGLLAGMLAALWMMGVRRPRVLLGVSFTVAASAYLLFMVLLETRFPRGPLERLLSSLFA